MTIYKLATAIFLTVSTHAIAQTSFWTNSTVPRTQQVTDDKASVTLGLKFYSDVPGYVTGVRFYKGSYNTGTHTGSLWSRSGAVLGTVTFSGETASGWQQANFSSPISITANTTYVISYLAPNGYYADDQYYSWTAVAASPLHVSGTAPGVYAYGSTAAFPTGTWNQSNYWIDVVFSPSTVSQPTPTSTYTISGTVTGSAATLTLSGTASQSTTTDSSGKYTFSSVPNGSYVVAPSQSGYTFTPSTTSVSINGASNTSVNFTATAVATTVPHTVLLSWNPSTSTNVKGYNVYRASIAGGEYSRINATPVSGTAYSDSTVSSGRTYYYVTTAVDTNTVESAYSNQATAVVPTP